MKIKKLLLFLLFVVFADNILGNGINETKNQDTTTMKIKITVGEKVLTATLENNETAKDLVAQFPLTVTLEDYASTEKIFYPDRKLSTAGAPSGYKPSVGDITYYAPWGDIAIFYKNFGFASGLINLGKIDGDMSALTGSKNVKATFELMED